VRPSFRDNVYIQHDVFQGLREDARRSGNVAHDSSPAQTSQLQERREVLTGINQSVIFFRQQGP